MIEQVSTYTDAVAAAEAVLAAALQKTFASCQARSLTGLASIHQLANKQGLPAWLLWCAGRPGAYQLDLAETFSAPHAVSAAVLALRYFPGPEETAMAEFTGEERRLRLSSAFDHTGTPVSGALDIFGTDLFALGRLGLFLDAQGGACQLTWDAPADGESVAAWDLGLPLVDALVSALCLARGQGPAAAGALRRFEGQGDPPPGWARLWVDFSGPSNLPSPEPGLMILANSNCGREAREPLNPEWWRIGQRHFHDAEDQCLCCLHDH